MRTWIQGYKGQIIEPLDLKPEQLDIETIAHSLSLKCRFTGQVKFFYSVAQHCWLGSKTIDPKFAMAFLLHELSECALPDIASPIKPNVFVMVGKGEDAHLISWVDLEKRHLKTVLSGLKLEFLEPLVYSEQVKQMDLAMLMCEKACLLGKEPLSWEIDTKPANIAIIPWDPVDAKNEFLNRYWELKKKI